MRSSQHVVVGVCPPVCGSWTASTRRGTSVRGSESGSDASSGGFRRVDGPGRGQLGCEVRGVRYGAGGVRHWSEGLGHGRCSGRDRLVCRVRVGVRSRASAGSGRAVGSGPRLWSGRGVVHGSTRCRRSRCTGSSRRTTYGRGALGLLGRGGRVARHRGAGRDLCGASNAYGRHTRRLGELDEWDFGAKYPE